MRARGIINPLIVKAVSSNFNGRFFLKARKKGIHKILKAVPRDINNLNIPICLFAAVVV